MLANQRKLMGSSSPSSVAMTDGHRRFFYRNAMTNPSSAVTIMPNANSSENQRNASETVS